MAQVQIVAPSPALREYILAFECISATSQAGDRFRVIWARPHVTMPFMLGPARDVYDHVLGRTLPVPDSVVVGTITRRFADVQFGERQRLFNIVFQPGGFYRLFGQPAGRLADHAVGTRELFGGMIDDLGERIRGAEGTQGRVATAEAALQPLLARARAPDPVHQAAARQIAAHGLLPISELITGSGCGARQFERRFLEHFGVSPKRYARIVRLNHALQLKHSARQLSWAVIGQLAGFFDQNHLIKDFKAMTGLLPSSYAEHMCSDDAPPLTSWPCATSSRVPAVLSAVLRAAH